MQAPCFIDNWSWFFAFFVGCAVVNLKVVRPSYVTYRQIQSGKNQLEWKLNRFLSQLIFHIAMSLLGYCVWTRGLFEGELLEVQLNQEYAWEYACYFGYWAFVFVEFVGISRVEEHESDYSQMLIHHVATFCALLSSDVFGFRKIGLLVLFLHDVSDIGIMLLKIVYKAQYPFQAQACVYAFCMVTWIVTRMVLFGGFVIFGNVIPRYWKHLNYDEDANFLTRVGYVLPCVALVTLLVCNAMWTWFLIQIPLKPPAEVVKEYEKTPNQQKAR